MKKIILGLLIFTAFAISCNSDDDNSLVVTKQNLLGKWYLKGGTINNGAFEEYNHDCSTSRDFQEFFDNDILTFNGYNVDCELNEVEESNWSLNGRIITVSIPNFMEYDIAVEKLTSNELILKQDGINEDTGAVEVVRYYMTRN